MAYRTAVMMDAATVPLLAMGKKSEMVLLCASTLLAHEEMRTSSDIILLNVACYALVC